MQTPIAAGFTKSWQAGSLRGLIVPLLVFGALWYLLIAQLSQFWAAVPEYSFGWFVPVCSGFLFLFRWNSRPSADIPKSRATRWILAGRIGAAANVACGSG